MLSGPFKLRPSSPELQRDALFPLSERHPCLVPLRPSSEAPLNLHVFQRERANCPSLRASNDHHIIVLPSSLVFSSGMGPDRSPTARVIPIRSFHFQGQPGRSSIARVERAHSYRARSASRRTTRLPFLTSWLPAAANSSLCVCRSSSRRVGNGPCVWDWAWR
jgi:hypothetical protein